MAATKKLSWKARLNDSSYIVHIGTARNYRYMAEIAPVPDGWRLTMEYDFGRGRDGVYKTRIRIGIIKAESGVFPTGDQVATAFTAWAAKFTEDMRVVADQLTGGGGKANADVGNYGSPLIERARRAAELSDRDRERLFKDLVAAMERMRLSLAILHTWASVDDGVGLIPEHVIGMCDCGLAAYKGVEQPPPLNPKRKAGKR